MKSAVWGICGIALSVVFVFAVGILSIQVVGLRGGAVLDLNNTLVAITSARVPYLPFIGIAALSTLAIFLLTVAVRKHAKRFRVAFVVGFSVATLVLVSLSFILNPLWAPDGTLTIGRPIEPGWLGWLVTGGSSPAVHVVFFLALASIWLYSSSGQRAIDSKVVSPTTHTIDSVKSAVWGICGIALSVVFVFAVGILSIQMAGLRLGAIVDLNNTLVAVTTAHVPFPQMIAIAVLSALVLFVLTVVVRKRATRSRVTFVIGFSVATLLLVSLAFVLAPFRGPVEGLSIGFEPGWVGWLGEGGSSPAVHVIFFLAVASIWLYSGARHPEAHSDSTTSTVQQ